MFFLLKIKVTVILEPKEISGDWEKVINQKLQEKYLMKVIGKEGLCVNLVEWSVKSNKIAPSSGNAQTDVLVNCVVL